MAAMRRILLLLVVFGVVVGPTYGATNPDLVYLQKTLMADMTKSFKKQAPNLKFTTVACTIPKGGGVTTQCKAYFTTNGVKGYYPVVAKFHDLGGTVSWSAQSPRCQNPTTKKYSPC